MRTLMLIRAASLATLLVAFVGWLIVGYAASAKRSAAPPGPSVFAIPSGTVVTSGQSKWEGASAELQKVEFAQSVVGIVAAIALVVNVVTLNVAVSTETKTTLPQS